MMMMSGAKSWRDCFLRLQRRGAARFRQKRYALGQEKIGIYAAGGRKDQIAATALPCQEKKEEKKGKREERGGRKSDRGRGSRLGRKKTQNFHFRFSSPLRLSARAKEALSPTGIPSA
jgi:hypothetical protein